MSDAMHKLRPVKFGFALGLWWGLSLMLVSWLSMRHGYGAEFIVTIKSLYHGYCATWLGGLMGFIWGFVDFFFFGLLIAWTYNCCSGCCKKSCD